MAPGDRFWRNPRALEDIDDLLSDVPPNVDPEEHRNFFLNADNPPPFYPGRFTDCSMPEVPVINIGEDDEIHVEVRLHARDHIAQEGAEDENETFRDVVDDDDMPVDLDGDREDLMQATRARIRQHPEDRERLLRGEPGPQVREGARRMLAQQQQADDAGAERMPALRSPTRQGVDAL